MSGDLLSPARYRDLSDHGWLYLLLWKRIMDKMNEDQAESYRWAVMLIVIPSVSIKD
jgi:hypothetical protein